MTEEQATPVRPTRHRRQVWLTVALTQIVLAALTIGGVMLSYNTLNGNIPEGEKISHETTKRRVADAGPMEPLNILVLGSDSRSGEATTSTDSVTSASAPTPRSCCTSLPTARMPTA